MALFQAIAREISSMQDVTQLADVLLDSIEPNGGKAWVDSKTADGAVANPQNLARAVLEHWCKYSQGKPFGQRLYEVLLRIVPRVAEHFEEQLSEEGSAVQCEECRETEFRAATEGRNIVPQAECMTLMQM